MPNPGQNLANQNSAIGPMVPRANPFFGLLPAEYASRLKDPFVYSIDMTITSLVTATSSAQVQNDSDFVCTDLTMTCTDSTSPGPVFTSALTVPALVQLIDSASGRQLQNQAISISAWFGTAQLPFTFRMPKIFRAGGQITATVQNQSASTQIFHLTFHGFKVFPIQAH